MSLGAVLNAIRDDLQKLDAAERRKQRYFTLNNLYNNPNVSADQLCLTRAAPAKVVNSLTWRDDVVPLRAVDANEIVFAVDIHKLGWTAETWKTVLSHYPYGLRYPDHPDQTLKGFDRDIQQALDGVEEPVHVRADWFIVTATRPPLYHTLMYDDFLPELKKRRTDRQDGANPKKMTDRDLEDYLGIDVVGNIFGPDPQAARAGFAQSGVSGQNRLVERHPLNGRAYWKSYDFKPTTWEANLVQFPLGPRVRRRTISRPWPSPTTAARSSSTCPTACRRICWSMARGTASMRDRSRS